MKKFKKKSNFIKHFFTHKHHSIEECKYLFRKNIDIVNDLINRTFIELNYGIKSKKPTSLKKNKSLYYNDHLIRKEILYRVTRIVMVICIFLIFTFFRNNTLESYNIAALNKDYLLNSLQVTELSKGVNRNDIPSSDEIGSSNDGYLLKVENLSDKKREVKFIAKDTLNNKDIALDHKYVRYQIICNNKIIKTSNISKNGILYKTTLDENSKNIYEIKFWIDEDSVDKAYGKKFSVKINII